MKDILKKLIASFDNTTDGFSARKMSAFVAIVTAIVTTFKFGNPESIELMLLIWLGFALLCLGIITVEQIIKFKYGNTPQQ